MTSKPYIPYAEFYITNVCNLTCKGCNRFNNHDFRGYQKWKDYQSIYAEWSRQVDIGCITILGGEPLLNPTFKEWLTGISNLWPKNIVRVVTNGWQLNKVSGLYDLLSSHKNMQLWVGIHNKAHKNRIFSIVQQFLTKPLFFDHDNSDPYREYLDVSDANQVSLRIEYNWWFHQGAIIHDADGKMTLHQSDPNKAHDICHMKSCHHFIKGKLYKCGVVAVLPEFDQQHPLTLSPQDRDLMLAYQPLEITSSLVEKHNFINSLSKTIPQCRFCPENYDGQQIFAEVKSRATK